jgi:hypothetical protein
MPLLMTRIVTLQVQTFGSFVNGLGMHSSDLDLVITGLLAPDHPQNGGPPNMSGVRTGQYLHAADKQQQMAAVGVHAGDTHARHLPLALPSSHI